MPTVCELHSFRRAAEASGMTEGEIVELIDVLALDPMAGEEIKGTGGCRKLRLAGRGKGKSGGYRTITSYSGSELPVFLITVFSKGERSDLTKADQNGLAKLTKELVEIYRAKVVRVRRVKRKRP